MHQTAELHGAGEISRAHHHIGKDHRGLRIALGEEQELLLPLHDGDPIRHHAAKAVEVTLAFGGFTVQRGDLLGIFARANQVEAEIGFETLLSEIERNQRPAEQMREAGADHRIDQCRPDQIARNDERQAEQVHRRGVGQSPQNDDERAERDAGIEQAGADRQRALHEHLEIFGDTLIGVVGCIAEQLHAIMVRGVQPLPQIGLRHPAPPADLQPQIQVVLVHREHGVDRRDRAKEQDGADEGAEIAVLQGVVKAIVPFVQDHLDGHERQLDGDDRAEQEPARPAVLGAVIRSGQPPDRGQCRDQTFHEKPPTWKRGTRCNAEQSTRTGAVSHAATAKAALVRCNIIKPFEARYALPIRR